MKIVLIIVIKKRMMLETKVPPGAKDILPVTADMKEPSLIEVTEIRGEVTGHGGRIGGEALVVEETEVCPETGF